jgi:hypothetical protein
MWPEAFDVASAVLQDVRLADVFLSSLQGIAGPVVT